MYECIRLIGGWTPRPPVKSMVPASEYSYKVKCDYIVIHLYSRKTVCTTHYFINLLRDYVY